jgi:hypothetical protein
MKRSTSVKIFISHSTSDRRAAAAFVELVRAALLVPANEICCTDLDGYKLAAGTDPEDRLSQEVLDATTFVALLSPGSLASIYLIFELGARWGAKGHIVPLMIRGVVPQMVRSQIPVIHAVPGVSEEELHRLVDTLAAQLKVRPQGPSVYTEAMRAFMAAAS